MPWLRRAWNTLVETAWPTSASGGKNRPEPAPGLYRSGNAQPVTPLSAIEAPGCGAHASSIEELDRVLGGGVVEAAWC